MFKFTAEILLVTMLIIVNITCNNPTSPPPPQTEKPKSVKLQLAEVSCTEAFINITASDTVLPVNITLSKNDTALISFTLTKTDTLVIDTTLQPNKTYKYHTIQSYNETSAELSVTTLNVTSDNYTWQTFTFGDVNAGSSNFNDCAIISDNDIWCVGEVNVTDSSENGYTTYNAAHWDGSKWELKRIIINFRGNNITPSLQGIFAFSKSQIWVVGGLAIYGDGINWLPYDVRKITGYDSLSFKQCWGNSADNMYFSGLKGSLAHYQNGTWQKIESPIGTSGTTADISEIWGTKELVYGNLKILATAASINKYKLLTLTSSSAKDTLDWQPKKSLSGIWLDGNKTYAGGTDIWLNKNNNWSQVSSTGYFFTRIRGTECNNIFGIGPDGTVHYNGLNWQIIKPRPEGFVIVSGDCRDNIVILVGFASNGGMVGQAAVLIGTRI